MSLANFLSYDLSLPPVTARRPAPLSARVSPDNSCTVCTPFFRTPPSATPAVSRGQRFDQIPHSTCVTRPQRRQDVGSHKTRNRELGPDLSCLGAQTLQVRCGASNSETPGRDGCLEVQKRLRSKGRGGRRVRQRRCESGLDRKPGTRVRIEGRLDTREADIG
jgi:hypothetical protein